MDTLQSLILSLDTQEVSDFKTFVQRHKSKKNRKDLRLFALQREPGERSKDEILEKLELENLNAYHTLRKRLYAELSEFIMFKSLESDDSKAARATGYYNLARHLFQRNIPQLGWKVLDKSERLAVQNELFDVLNAIYLLNLEYNHIKEKPDFDEVNVRYLANKEKLKIQEAVLLSKAQILRQAKQSKMLGKPLDLMPVIETNLSKYALTEELRSSPKILFEYLQAVRKATQISKSYYALEQVLDTYILNLNNVSNIAVNVELLFMQAHTKYRNKKFAESLQLIDRIEGFLADCSKQFNRQIGLKIVSLKANNFMLLGDVEKAIATLEPERNKLYHSPTQQSNIIVILGIYSFLKGDNEESLRLLNEMQHSEKWYEKKMGMEWTMKKNLMEVLLFGEMGKIEVVESRIRSIERRFKSLIDLPEYARVKTFLSLIKVVLISGEDMDYAKLRDRVEGVWKWVPAEKEDLQAVLFYSYLKSKIMRKSFYETVLDTL